MYIMAENIKKGDKLFIDHTTDKIIVARWPLNETLWVGTALCDMVIGYYTKGNEIEWKE